MFAGDHINPQSEPADRTLFGSPFHRVYMYRHAPGAHCGSAALRNLADHYGWGFDEAKCFGLGAGIGFEYSDSGPASRMIMGRGERLESAFFEHLGVPVTHREGASEADAWAALEDRLEAGPVAGFVDLYYLPYFDSDTHFGPHTVVVTDIEGDSVTVSDSEFPDPKVVDRRAFDDAWSSEHGFWPLKRRWLAVDDPEPTVGIEAATRTAIGRAAETMLGGGGGAIRAFAEDLPGWTRFDDAGWTARFAYQNIERRGTGGGAFRRLYADFLDTLGVEAGLDDRFAERAGRIADDWTGLADVLRAVSETDEEGERADLLAGASERASDLADRERGLFADLAGAV
jgi:hypothetical protein